MPNNIGYRFWNCNFKRTYEDFKDCYESLNYDGLGELSDEEKKYAKMLVKISQQMTEKFADRVEDED